VKKDGSHDHARQLLVVKDARLTLQAQLALPAAFCSRSFVRPQRHYEWRLPLDHHHHHQAHHPQPSRHMHYRRHHHLARVDGGPGALVNSARLAGYKCTVRFFAARIQIDIQT
jgi:hypothetical protein